MDKDGNTYLHLAAVGNQTLCELLLKYDAEIITLLNRKDKTARDIPKEIIHINNFSLYYPKHLNDLSFVNV